VCELGGFGVFHLASLNLRYVFGGVRLRKKSDSQHQESSNALIVFHLHRAYFQVLNRPSSTFYGQINECQASQTTSSRRSVLASDPNNHPRAIIHHTISNPPKSSFPSPPASTGPPKIFSRQQLMTSISHVFLLTDFLTSIKVAAK
jgi:hypothetical protein